MKGKEVVCVVYTIDQIKAIVTPIAEKYRLPAVYLFGSYARGTATEESDVDLLVDTAGTNLTTLLRLGGLYCDLEEALGKEIDLVTLNSLEGPCRRESDLHFRERVNRERRKIYAVA